MQRRFTSTAAHRARRGFSLVELLVVIGIIILLISILLPAIEKAFRSSDKVRTRADLTTLETALAAYKNDTGDFPRNARRAINDIRPSNRGLLARALLGVGALPAPSHGLLYPGTSGYTAPTPTGQPYLQQSAMKTNAGQNSLTATYGNSTDLHDELQFVDHYGNIIYYYPPINPNSNFLLDYPPSTANAARWDARDSNYVDQASPSVLMLMLGDDNKNNQIDAGEQLRPTTPYLLISSGADGKNGPQKPSPTKADADKCDDVFNFER